jgi:hypothetical protein
VDVVAITDVLAWVRWFKKKRLHSHAWPVGPQPTAGTTGTSLVHGFLDSARTRSLYRDGSAS